MAMLQLWLFLHILGAIVAFGFGFYAPIYGAMAANEPQHGNWYLRSTKRVSDMILVPAALSMGVTGVLIVLETGGMSRFQEPWLGLAMVIYVAAILAVLFVQRPALNRVIELTSEPPGPDGPPAEVPKLLRRLRMLGIALLIAVIAIVYLMVVKPTL
jgi:uncharacterized membrane protein